MGVILHAHYRLTRPDGQNIVMPAPVEGWASGTRIVAEIADSRRDVLVAASSLPARMHLILHGLPAAGSSYELTVTFTGTQELAI